MLRDFYIVKTGNDLAFHYSHGEKLDIISHGYNSKEISIEDLEKEPSPVYILDPGSEQIYTVTYITKVRLGI